MPGYGCVPCYTFRLLECIDMAERGEYWSLDDKDQAFINMLLSCSQIDMTPSSPLLIKLKTLFPVGTTTRTKIEDMISYFPPIIT